MVLSIQRQRCCWSERSACMTPLCITLSTCRKFPWWWWWWLWSNYNLVRPIIFLAPLFDSTSQKKSKGSHTAISLNQSYCFRCSRHLAHAEGGSHVIPTVPGIWMRWAWNGEARSRSRYVMLYWKFREGQLKMIYDVFGCSSHAGD